MKIKSILAAIALMAAGSASATVLNFDGLTEMMYGDGFPLAGSMSYNGTNLSYVESGFQLTLNAPNAAAESANIGTGTYEPQTFNWHDGLDNGSDTYVTLTRVGGGTFNLNSFDYYMDWSTVSADGTLLGSIQDAGLWSTALNGITELRISSGAFNQLDNVDVDAATGSVPLPGTLALMLAGLGAAGLTRRRRG
ncbi:PEP-CTERM sorting domain-containing protein [Duganella sp. FT92W]|uniref:PEP-CTERM sorting domain-containing protein n=1 Tax=Pseudoduganella rivuli TaxID=2666085 RepID=A0A7X2LT56_9BURK|nr:PEP-CTERM sorting domain-containing protein [Pseudoduganella rivuli]MRV72633.1 PEP-CTERM sorting domain-containing protein [Pseudoduganella rivuli]